MTLAPIAHNVSTTDLTNVFIFSIRITSLTKNFGVNLLLFAIRSDKFEMPHLIRDKRTMKPMTTIGIEPTPASPAGPTPQLTA